MRATADELIDRATAETGLRDFGADGWQEGLDEMVAALAVDVPDDDGAASRVEDILVERLSTRLRIEQWYAEHGEEASAPVEGPLVIMGLPRTATTATHHMLSLDPQIRYLRTWERDQPLPPPDIATEQSDPRRVEPEQSDDAHPQRRRPRRGRPGPHARLPQRPWAPAPHLRGVVEGDPPSHCVRLPGPGDATPALAPPAALLAAQVPDLRVPTRRHRRAVARREVRVDAPRPGEAGALHVQRHHRRPPAPHPRLRARRLVGLRPRAARALRASRSAGDGRRGSGSATSASST